MLKKLVFSALFLFISSGFLLTFQEGHSQGVINLPQTGQTKCYHSSGAEISCSGTGQDGELQAGVKWPGPRFTVNGDCVIDNLTGLMWAKNANLPAGARTWQGALDFIASINAGAGLCGYPDWRLPNVNELESFLNSDEAATAPWLITQGFSNVQSYYYWSSTSYDDTNYKWFVDMGNGYVDYYNQFGAGFVWPVRSDSPNPGFPANVWKTGQRTSYAAGDDGDLETGVAWPPQRFTDNQDGTVTDNLTGLMWAKNADLPNGYKTWQEALEYVRSVAIGGYDDWRLPNRKELFSLIDRSMDNPANPALPAGHPFQNVQPSSYWSSTSHTLKTDWAWLVKVWNGYVHFRRKSLNYYVWPVRSGQGPFGYPDISVAPNPVSFGNVIVGSTSDQVVTVKNAGDTDLEIGAITNPSPPFTKISDNCSGQTVTPGGTCTVTYGFSPHSEGTFSSSSNIFSNDPDENPKTVALTGNGISSDAPEITVAPSSIDFGNVRAGGFSGPQSVAIRNDGNADLSIGNIIPSALPFSKLTDDCSGRRLAPGGSCVITYGFSPASEGNFSSQSSIPSDDPDENPVSVRLSGSGVTVDVTVTATVGLATEAGPTTGTYRIARTGSTASSLSVSFTMGGSAQNGVDYNTITSPVTIPAGASSVNVILTPIDDLAYEGNEAAILTVSANPAYGIGSPSSATITIQDNEPVVTVTAIDNAATEVGPTTGTYRIARTGSTASSLSVSFTMGGSAQNGVDYNTITSPVTIPAGASSVNVILTPIDDLAYEGNEAAILTISANPAYGIGSPSSATITIQDNEPVVTVTAIDNAATEVGPTTGTYRIARTGSTASSLSVSFTMGGSAQNGVDYNTITSPVTIPAGASSVNVILTPIDDLAYEGNEAAILTISANPAYGIGSPSSATITIMDNEPVVTVAAIDNVATEAGPTTGTYRISRAGPTTSSLSVYFAMAGPALNGTDYITITSPVTIPAGFSYVNVTLTPINDSVYEGNETATLTISANPAYGIGSPSSATITIQDNEPVVTVTAADSVATEAGPTTGMYRILRTGATTSSLIVSFTMGGSAQNGADYTMITSPVTIPAGFSYVNVTLTPINDSVHEGNETAILTISANPAYGIGSPSSATITIQDNDL